MKRSSRQITPKKRAKNLEDLNDMQLRFIEELLQMEAWIPSQAARIVGYKNPSQAANKLLKNEAVQAALGKAKRERSERCQINADDLLDYLRTALYLNPLRLFKRSESGYWVVDDLDAVPEMIGRLVKAAETKTTTDKDGVVTSTIKLEFFNKEKAAELIQRHIDTLQIDVNIKGRVDWNIINGLSPPLFTDNRDVPDLIEHQIELISGPKPKKKKSKPKPKEVIDV